jgi:hypothetical protein
MQSTPKPTVSILYRIVQTGTWPGVYFITCPRHGYQNFAITDDAVIFFFNQDGLLSHVDGPLTVKVPRTELAALLA